MRVVQGREGKGRWGGGRRPGHVHVHRSFEESPDRYSIPDRALVSAVAEIQKALSSVATTLAFLFKVSLLVGREVVLSVEAIARGCVRESIRVSTSCLDVLSRKLDSRNRSSFEFGYHWVYVLVFSFFLD